jgi:ABC-2 type transport system ATP-binding protein
MAADSAIAEVIDVTKRFRDVVALSRVNLTLRSGVTGLLGPNGAGKTTLMRCVSTLLRADEGSVTAFGVDVRDSESRSLIRRRIGFMPQEFGFYEGFTDSLRAFTTTDHSRRSPLRDPGY